MGLFAGAWASLRGVLVVPIAAAAAVVVAKAQASRMKAKRATCRGDHQ
jgi:hypothetical protein